jgi:hypothetical protein
LFFGLLLKTTEGVLSPDCSGRQHPLSIFLFFEWKYYLSDFKNNIYKPNSVAAMNKNQTLFDDLPEKLYFKSNEKALKHFQKLADFPDALGFDEDSSGFIALHKDHAASGIDSEIPVCLILKNLGFAIVLLPELPNVPSLDATIDGTLFEIKSISKAKNIQNAIQHQLQGAAKKAENVLLHINQPCRAETLRGALYKGVKHYPKFQKVWVVFKGKLFQFDKASILKGKYQFV